MTHKTAYFSHDANARQDERIVPLLMRHGNEGYGVYWSLIELLRQNNAFELPTQYECYAFALRTQCELVESIINDFKLFIVDDEKGVFYSLSLKKRMSLMTAKSERARAAAAARWDKHANAMQTHSGRNATKLNQTKVKESKVNKNSKKRALKFCPKTAADKLDWIDNELWSEWVDHKIKLKLSVTKRAINANINKIKKLSNSDKKRSDKLIILALERNWKDFYEQTTTANTNNNTTVNYQTL